MTSRDALCTGGRAAGSKLDTRPAFTWGQGESERFLKELKAVAPGIFGEKAWRIRDGLVVDNSDAVGEKGLAQIVEVANGESGVSFLRRTELAFDSHMKLVRATLEPAAAPSAQCGWLFKFVEAKDLSIKLAGSGLAPFRRRELYVIYADNLIRHDSVRIPNQNG